MRAPIGAVVIAGTRATTRETRATRALQSNGRRAARVLGGGGPLRGHDKAGRIGAEERGRGDESLSIGLEKKIPRNGGERVIVG